MHVTNADIAAVFAEIADWLELDAENPFRIRAYRNAARTIEAWPAQLAGMPQERREFAKLPGIGTDLGEKIGEILHSGTCSLLVRLRKSHPRGLTELLKVPGIGPRRVARLHRELGITTLSGLVRAARARRISTLKGFGRRSEDTLLQAAVAHLGSEQRWSIAVASQHADAITAYLRGSAAVLDIAVAGSFRRGRETVGDLDVLVSSRKPAQAAARFLAYPPVARVLARGSTRCSAILKSGLQVDLRVVAPHSFGAALVYFTGSKAHNIALRRGAQQRGLKISEYGVFRGATRVAGATEAAVYATVGLPLIAPELREDHGEIQAARENRLPQLIERYDLRGDLHAHTNATDGHASIAEMAAAAKSASLSYVAITDHSQGLGIVHGLDAGRLLHQIDAIDRFNADARGITVLKGIEVEILEDGRLGLADDVLARLDLVVAAVHSHFHLSRTRQTARILRAMDHPCFSVLAHPTGRLLGERAPYVADIERVIRHARERACFLELNAQPSRLDLDDVQARMAADAGVRLAICSDAHDVNGFAALRFGVGQARRAWLERRHVVNTLPLVDLRRLLAATMLKRPLAA
jgi:DNA polymerase (family 10)